MERYFSIFCEFDELMKERGISCPTRMIARDLKNCNEKLKI